MTTKQEDWKRNYDVIPRIMENRTAFVIGGGPSLRNHDPGLLAGRPVVVTNEAFALHPEADALVFVDVGWWQRRKEAIRKVWQGGLIIARGNYKRIYAVDKCLTLAYRSGFHWSLEPRILGGKNSGLAAINAAFHMGAIRVVLLGFDMRPVEGRNNYHGLHPVSGTPNFTHRYTGVFIPEFAMAAVRMEDVGLLVVNATPGTALDCFPKRSLEWCLEKYPI